MVMRRLFGLILALSILAPASPLTTSAPAAPRLVVMLVVDQMRNDYIDDYGSNWTHGLRRLVSEGARFRNAAYPYFNTVTCAGHATIGTGTVPAIHGIILNQWWHREDQRERMTRRPRRSRTAAGSRAGGTARYGCGSRPSPRRWTVRRAIARTSSPWR
jgi:hypothetical protein